MKNVMSCCSPNVAEVVAVMQAEVIVVVVPALSKAEDSTGRTLPLDREVVVSCCFAASCLNCRMPC